jgi:predicted metal-dependent HD superfamily phosphohydrolase
MPPADRAVLQDAWNYLLRVLRLDPGETFNDLAARYSGPERYYHNLDHVGAMLASVMELGGAAANRRTLTLAAWLHDVIYDPRARDNEERSAEYARALLGRLGLATPLVDETARLILLTKDHRAQPGDVDGCILLDADLAILGAAPERYDAYVAAVRREYAWVPEGAWRTGRTEVLDSFLGRPRIFHTSTLFEHAEARARQNLQRERDGLLAGKSSSSAPNDSFTDRH